jgi:hypothetical protein
LQSHFLATTVSTVGFEFFTAVVLKSIIFWDMTPFFDPEDGDDTFLQNIGYNSTDFTASYPRR